VEKVPNVLFVAIHPHHGPCEPFVCHKSREMTISASETAQKPLKDISTAIWAVPYRARICGLSRRSVSTKIAQHDIDTSAFKSDS
jgi:hypothetical protein